MDYETMEKGLSKGITKEGVETLDLECFVTTVTIITTPEVEQSSDPNELR